MMRTNFYALATTRRQSSDLGHRLFKQLDAIHALGEEATEMKIYEFPHYEDEAFDRIKIAIYTRPRARSLTP